MTIIECVKCKEKKRLGSEILWYKGQGYCRYCYYEKAEYPLLMKSIFNSCKKGIIGCKKDCCEKKKF